MADGGSDSDEEQWLRLCGGELDASDFTDRVPDVQADAVGPICTETEFTYVPALPRTQRICVQQEREKGLSFQIWPSSTFLADFAVNKDLQAPGCWKGKRVLELGCGCGLVGLVWASLGADVLLTDLPSVLNLIQHNIDLNAALIAAGGGSATAIPCSWGEPVDKLGSWATPDVIVAADVVYHRELFNVLLSTLAALGQPGTRFVLAHVRRWKTDKHFFTALRRLYTVEDVTGELDATSAALDSHTKGSRRLFSCTKK